MDFTLLTAFLREAGVPAAYLLPIALLLWLHARREGTKEHPLQRVTEFVQGLDRAEQQRAEFMQKQFNERLDELQADLRAQDQGAREHEGKNQGHWKWLRCGAIADAATLMEIYAACTARGPCHTLDVGPIPAIKWLPGLAGRVKDIIEYEFHGEMKNIF